MSRGSRKKTPDDSELSFEQLFVKNPQPMWIYDARTLRFLEVNEAALSKYGYTKEEFLKMYVTEIRPKSEVEKFLKTARPGSPFFSFDGVWKHKFRNGETADMEIFSNMVVFQGQLAVAVTAHDITEREESRRTIHLQTDALEAAANGIIITDANGTIIWANSAFSRMTGFGLDEAIGRNPRVLVKSGKHDASFYKNMWDTILAGGVWHGELVNKRKDGTLYSEEMTITPIRDEGSEITHFVAIKQDVTGRKELEKAIVHGEKRLQELMDFLPQTVYEIDRSGKLTFANRTGFEMFRLREGDFERGLDVLQFIAPEDRERARDDIARALKTGKTLAAAEYRMVRKDGTTFPSIEYGSVIVRDGEAVGLRGLIVDISAQKDAEQIATSLQSRFETIFNNTRDAMILLKGDRLIDCNLAAVDLFAGSRDEILGRTIENLSPKVQPDGVLSKKKSVDNLNLTLSGKPQFLEWQHRKIDGAIFEAEISLSKVGLDGGDVVLAVIRDVTQRKLLEAQLHQAQRLESLGQLTSGIAHDFNNVLGGIIGFSELSLRKLDSKVTVEAYLNRVKDLAVRAAKITKQLVAFSRKQVLQPKDINLNDLVGEFVQFLPGMIRDDIRVKFEPDLELGTVHADRSQLEQVLVNLAVNASDAMPNGGELLFKTRNAVVDGSNGRSAVDVAAGNYAVLAVTDTGIGMEKEILGRVFEPFFTTKGVGKGTGLGLSVVHGIVEQHRGTVCVTSEPDKGTTFEIYLPSISAGTETIEGPSEVFVPAKSSSERILIVEDNAALRELLTTALEDSGYKVVHAGDGEEGLRLFESGMDDISLVVSDVLMPRMSGKQLRDKIRKKNPRMKFLFMSGYAAAEGDDDFMIEPGSDFIQKPFGISEINAKVSEILDRE